MTPDAAAVQSLSALAEVVAEAFDRPCPFQPTEFNVVVELDPAESKTPGGIILLDSKTERDRLASDEGTLIAVSPHAFTYADWPEGARRPQLGDRILFPRYTGILRETDGRTFRVIKDKDVVAVIGTGEGG
jgi:chaperonin GroES